MSKDVPVLFAQVTELIGDGVCCGLHFDDITKEVIKLVRKADADLVHSLADESVFPSHQLILYSASLNIREQEM